MSQLLLLTGTPGIGKTTVIQKVAENFPAGRLGGFYTQEVRRGERRLGFRLITFDDRNEVFAHVDFTHQPHIGKYGVNIEVVDRLSVSALAEHPAIDFFLVDEIGKMECLSPRFIHAFRQLLKQSKPIVATVALRGSGFIQEIKECEQAVIREVNFHNRNQLPHEVLEWLSGCHP
jgi:nucleoside-triphosphatase